MNFQKLNRLTFDDVNLNNDFVRWGDGKMPTRPRFEYKELTENDYMLIIQAKTRLDEIVYHSVFEYLNNENLCNSSENMFPNCDCMTGNYYVSDEFYSLRDGDIYGSVFTRFTENSYLQNEPTEQDYLGLEVWFKICKCGKIEIHGIDSSSI